MAAKTKALGEDIWKRTDKINAELFAMTYGSLVVQLVKDYEDYGAVNEQLDKMGYNMGTRLVEDFLARTAIGRCQDFREVGETLAKVGFKAFLNIVPNISHNPNPDLREFALTFDENPLAEFVELPDDAYGTPASETDGTPASEGLWFSNVLCGVIRGALEMLQYQVTARFVSDTLRGDDTTEMRVQLVKLIQEEVPRGDD
ncbi:uncharacterized protein L969DRAFT_14616 [Mixia osmundae IAM 14324]|uniref:Trafficking protein particle complex subunit BET3 n=1 Tax=Mixia osmundae (strain CBS 9802 / IAM 14324 / JCM 22182 / KY 12970) TaxID=764103 RepID=G7E2V1_MIXOS|nr:uncharacterized protein L969DRAFT_14616 [Mixia osmundae IAM 14324]KEI42415.1 hypothetical protein L969DRAFT_14616 [Mixia osmundae IAM 14324]GAA97295.1 hypothetical protein E5Q_03973 [Mixia osmundae IAM 14324]